ncbi:ATP-dependent Clp protease proteolytic subunit, partial [Megasphaera elsdenii]|uniref:ATP-dependent Clp protease proteolytic subunit n=2 Tax=Bacillota TaxID=1239 RepID=UPI002E7810D6
HNPATLAYGDQAEMEKTIGMLSEVKESIINAYEIKSGLARTKISHMMDDETWLNAKKAVELGFADEILFDQKKDDGEQPEAMIYTPVTVTNSLVQKLKPREPVNKVPAASLENRLALLIH